MTGVVTSGKAASRSPAPAASGVPKTPPPIRFSELLRRGAPDYARRMGRFGLAAFSLLVGQRLMDRGWPMVEHSSPAAFLSSTVEHLRYQVKLEGEENLPATGDFVIAANHPTGGPEGIILLWLLVTRYGDAVLPANRVLTELPGIAPLIQPVDVFENGRRRLRKPEEFLRAGAPVLFFPAGLTARVRGGRLREYPWQRGFVRVAASGRRPVVPVRVESSPSPLFRGVAALRRLFGVRVNVEMFLLFREFLRRGRRIRLRVGPPIDVQTENDDLKSAGAIARKIQRLVEKEL